MSYLPTRLQQGMNSIINKAGLPIRIQYFTQIYDDTYDVPEVLTQSGADLWTSGVVLPISQSNGADSVQLEQGKIIMDDKALYLNGSLILTGSEMQISIRLGSPGNSVDNQFSPLDFSLRVDAGNIPIYKKVYIRQIGGTGSLWPYS